MEATVDSGQEKLVSTLRVDHQQEDPHSCLMRPRVSSHPTLRVVNVLLKDEPLHIPVDHLTTESKDRNTSPRQHLHISTLKGPFSLLTTATHDGNNTFGGDDDTHLPPGETDDELLELQTAMGNYMKELDDEIHNSTIDNYIFWKINEARDNNGKFDPDTLCKSWSKFDVAQELLHFTKDTFLKDVTTMSQVKSSQDPRPQQDPLDFHDVMDYFKD